MGAEDFAGTERFAIRRRLGQGGMGVVYEAWDHERSAAVALKALRLADASLIYNFKREFRALADVSHPNLAALHELLRAGEQWFYTMELVSGRDFLSWVRPGGAIDVGRLRSALEQLAEGIAALHQAGKLHRDLKPSNVLVTEEGRVVVLDFGLVADIGPQPIPEGGSPILWGTPDYMAPEQATASSLGPAADWYACGVMLYQALTGRLPFRGTYLETLMDRQRFEPPPPREHAPGIPQDLDALCADLLRRDPTMRPSGAEVLRRVGSITDQRVAVLAPATPPAITELAGREAHLAELHRALAAAHKGRTVTVLVEGPSGMGKSALMRHFLEEVARSKAGVVLAGRCYERESVPYKALDSLIDALARHLMTLPRREVEALLPRDVLALARVFPTLKRVEAVVDRPRPPSESPDPREQRRAAFAALRELLAALADATTLVLFIDDLHWADADSMSLLAELVRPPQPPPLLLLCAWRAEDAATSAALRPLASGELALGPDVRRLRVGALEPAEAERLARALLGADIPDAATRAAEIAREAGGQPYLVVELCRHLRSDGGALGELSLEAVISARLRRFPTEARRLLDAVCLAARPLPQAVVGRAAGLPGGDLVPLAILRAGHLVRTRGPRDADLVEPYHDRIRDIVTAQLSAEAQRELHRRLAVALEAHGAVDPGALAVHFRAAGLRDRATEWALKAAARAETALAFDGAASLYRAGVEEAAFSAGEARALQRKLGDALANAGRGRDAADAYLASARDAAEEERLELQRLAAEQLLQSGHIDDGLALIGAVLRAQGLKLPETPRQALRSFVIGRVKLRARGMRFTPRPRGEIPPAELARIDLHWGLASALGLVDTVRGADFQTRHVLLALRAGDAYRAVRALTAEVAYQSVSGASGRARAHEVLALAESLRPQVQEPHGLALLGWAQGVLAFMEGRFADTIEVLAQSERTLRERCVAVAWELDIGHAFTLWSLFYTGELDQLVERVPVMLADARERGDRFGANMFSNGWANLAWLCVGDALGARRVVESAMAGWAFGGFHLQHYLELLALGGIDLYTGDAEAAWRRIEERWRPLERSMQLRVQHNRIEMRFLRARSAIAGAHAAAARGELAERDRRLVRAEADARALDKEDLAWPRGLAWLCRGGVCDARGDRAGAVAAFERALALLQQQRLPLHATCARRRLGELLAGDQGRDLLAIADDELAAIKVREPARFVGIWAPSAATAAPATTTT